MSWMHSEEACRRAIETRTNQLARLKEFLEDNSPMVRNQERLIAEARKHLARHEERKAS